MKVIGIFLSILLATLQAEEPISCNLRTNRDFSPEKPLILKKIKGTNEYEFDYPDKGDSLLFEPNENILLACPGKGFSQNEGDETVMNVQCVQDTNFRADDEMEVKPFKDYNCLGLPESTLERNGKCFEGNSALKIGFKVNEKVFVKIIDICFDENKNSALYSKHKVMPFIEGSQKAVKRVDFMEGGFFSDIIPNDAYSRNNQKDNVFSDQPESWKEAHINKREFIARGHFSPMADFVYGPQKTATFYYINVAPQWQSLNGGNWLQLENSIRQLSINNNLELTVYTGTHGIYERSGKERYLIDNESGKTGIPIPLFFWKVVYDQQHNKAVAFIGLNDPDANPEDNPAKEKFIDVCSTIKWVSLKPNPQKGLIYCCAVKEFSKIVTTLPPIADDMTQLSLLDDELVEKKSNLSRSKSQLIRSTSINKGVFKNFGALGVKMNLGPFPTKIPSIRRR